MSCFDYILANIHEVIKPLADVERDAIMTAIILCRGNVSFAARSLGMSRTTLDSRLRKYRRAEHSAERVAS